jgi:hypothetical protein
MNKIKSKFQDIFIFVMGIIFSISVTALAECSTTISSNNVTYGSSNTNAALASLITTATSINTRLTTAETNISSKAEKTIDHLEMTSSSGAGHGGYFDFHYNNSSDDFTSRIIEDASGRINLVAPTGIRVNGGRILGAPTAVTVTASMGTIAENSSFRMGSAVFLNFQNSSVTCAQNSTCVIATIPYDQAPTDYAACTATDRLGVSPECRVVNTGTAGEIRILTKSGGALSGKVLRVTGSIYSRLD